MLYVASEYFLWFLTYSVAGWIWEVILFAFTDKKSSTGVFVRAVLSHLRRGGILMWLTLNWTSNILSCFSWAG